MEENEFKLQPFDSRAWKIGDNLWIGNVPPIGSSLKEHFDILILCSEEFQPDPGCFFRIKVMQCPLTDHGLPLNPIQRKLAIKIALEAQTQLRTGARILVTCFAGLNRSSLVAGLISYFASNNKNVEAIVENIRAKRGEDALCNPFFVKFLREFDMEVKKKYG